MNLSRSKLPTPRPPNTSTPTLSAWTLSFESGARKRRRPASAASTLSLVVSQPAAVKRIIGTAIAAGATPLKPVAKSLWGWGGAVQTPDGTIWKVATSAKKDTGPDTGQIDQFVLLLGATDFAASKRFYVDRGFTVSKSFGKYAEFATPSSSVKFVLYGLRGLAKDAGVPADGTGSHRLTIGSDLGSFTDPDGFTWEAASV